MDEGIERLWRETAVKDKIRHEACYAHHGSSSRRRKEEEGGGQYCSGVFRDVCQVEIPYACCSAIIEDIMFRRLLLLS